jgi:thymidylate kinase
MELQRELPLVHKTEAPGQLVSVDAVRGRDLVPSAKRLLNLNGVRRPTGGFSTWDASSIFFELRGAETQSEETPSAQTLLLLYAADLRFRLRWQIEPALLEGQTVVAAPYVETGMAFGLALGLSRKWITELFRFAPKPSAAFWVAGGPASSPPTAGFLEFCRCDLPMRDEFFQKFVAHFDELARRGKCRRLA